LRHPAIVQGPDGPHPTVDLRDFTTQYWAYSGDGGFKLLKRYGPDNPSTRTVAANLEEIKQARRARRR
jgi:hypothetical protein